MRELLKLFELTMFVKMFKRWFISCIIVLHLCLLDRTESIYVQTVVTAFRQPPQQSSQQHRQHQHQHHDQHKSNSIADQQVLRYAPSVFKDDAVSSTSIIDVF